MAKCVLGGENGPSRREPTGIFATWDWDGHRLTARTDRFGFQPLFYASDGSTFWLSPSIPELIRQGAPRQLDDAGLAVFLRLGVFLENDTPFLHVRSAPPAARIRWEEGRLTVDGARAHRPTLEIGRDTAVKRYAELFSAAIAKTGTDSERVVVPLSGGRDSRHILLEIKASGSSPHCVTIRPMPPKSNEDAAVAAAVAAAVNSPHILLGPTTDRYGDEAAKNQLTSLCVLEHFWIMELVRYLAGRDAIVYDGIAGDTLSEAKYMSEHRMALFRRNDLRRYAEEELPGDGYMRTILKPKIYARFSRGLALERLERELATHVDAPNPVGSYRLWNRTRRGVALAPFGMLSTVATVRAPFLDDELFDFLASLPGEMLVDRRFHSDTIGFAYPELAGLPYEDPEAPEQSASDRHRAFGRAALRRGVGSILRAMVNDEDGLLRHTGYLARLAVLLGSTRTSSIGSLVTLAVYLDQLEALARDS